MKSIELFVVFLIVGFRIPGFLFVNGVDFITLIRYAAFDKLPEFFCIFFFFCNIG